MLLLLPPIANGWSILLGNKIADVVLSIDWKYNALYFQLAYRIDVRASSAPLRPLFQHHVLLVLVPIPVILHSTDFKYFLISSIPNLIPRLHTFGTLFPHHLDTPPSVLTYSFTFYPATTSNGNPRHPTASRRTAPILNDPRLAIPTTTTTTTPVLPLRDIHPLRRHRRHLRPNHQPRLLRPQRQSPLLLQRLLRLGLEPADPDPPDPQAGGLRAHGRVVRRVGDAAAQPGTL